MPETDQHTGIDTRMVARAGAAIAAMLALAMGGAYVAWRGWGQESSHSAPNTPFDLHIEGAALESAPQADRAAYMAQKEMLLHGYAWVDRQAGIARIPIEQAMGILAQETATKAATASAQPTQPTQSPQGKAGREQRR